MCVAETQLPEPSLLLPRVVEFGAEVGLEPRTPVWDAGVQSSILTQCAKLLLPTEMNIHHLSWGIYPVCLLTTMLGTGQEWHTPQFLSVAL